MRTSIRAVTLGVLSNVVFTGLTWFQTATYFHPGVNAVALLVVMASASWLILRVGKRILDRRDVLAVILAQATASLALAVTPHTGPSSGASIWTQGWSVTSVCAAMLLFPRVTGGLLVALSSLSYALVRFTEVRPVIALIEAAIPVLGATVVTWAAHATSSRYREAQVAAEVAAARAEAAEEARAREQARDWWKRILHDKVIGALLLASRATATSQLAQARHLAQDALETLDTIEELDADRQDAHLDLPLTVSAQDDLHIPLTDRLYRTAVRHGLLPDVSEGWTLAGSSRSIPPAVAEAILAAADQVFSNVARHSRTTTVAVRVTQSPTQVTVRVRDDGVGFDPSAVDTRRQGLSVSLPGHMALVSGSSAVQSALGKGTTVTLKWQAADSTVGLTNVTAEQVRAWWWVTALFASLHLGACWFSGLPIAVGVVGWTGLAVWLIGMGLPHIRPGMPRKELSPLLVLAGTAAMLSTATLVPGEGQWGVWFVGASFPALVIPALLGSRWLSVLFGHLEFVVIVVTYAIRTSLPIATSLVVAIPLLVIPGVAWLFSYALSIADRRLAAAQGTASTARRDLLDSTVRQRIMRVRARDLADNTVPLLRKLVEGELFSASDRESARLAEAANRDQLVAGDVLTDSLVRALGVARARGVTVHLTSSDDKSNSLSAGHAERLVDFRNLLEQALATAAPRSAVTARWQPLNSYASGTINVTDGEDDRFASLPAVGGS